MENQRIRDLQREIERERTTMAGCNHTFGKTNYNPYTVQEPYGSRGVGQGSHFWTEPEGYRYITKDRWTRICEKCGYENHTMKQKDVVLKQEPDFG